jgi:clan AA aspartic protease
VILGTVNGSNEAVVPITLLGADGREHSIEAVVDTGFNGYLMLPPALIDALGFGWQTQLNAMLADGSYEAFDMFAARFVWDGGMRTADAAAADTDPLVGMALLRGYAFEVHVTEGGIVRIQPLP